LYLTDIEATLQVINKWIGGGAKLRLVKTADTDILRALVLKLQKKVKAKTTTLLIKVKAHCGCPLNEEEDIRAEMTRMKGEQERTWRKTTNRTIYQWSETSKIKTGTLTPPNNQRGLKQSETGCDRKQVKSKLTEHMKREWKNVARNTSYEKEEETSLKKDRSYWRTKTNGGTRHPY